MSSLFSSLSVGAWGERKTRADKETATPAWPRVQGAARRVYPFSHADQPKAPRAASLNLATGVADLKLTSPLAAGGATAAPAAVRAAAIDVIIAANTNANANSS